MLSADCSRFQTEIIEHFRNGHTALSAEAKTHFATCEVCLAAVTKALDQATPLPSRPTRGATDGAPRDATLLCPAAQQALEHGRQVLKREFGITFSSTGNESQSG